ncbi:MAG: UDP-galactose transporter [Alyxoria varia]|nr:MAG: UDP-galactose transporter [Alyxoria varia]
MARSKPKSPMKREPSNDWIDHRVPTEDSGSKAANGQTVAINGRITPDKVAKPGAAVEDAKQAGLGDLIICVGGIYVSFIMWSWLQERITTTNYGTARSPEIFNAHLFMNTVQSAFAACVGYAYLRFSSRSLDSIPPVFPSRDIVPPLVLVAITYSLASPFGYASIKHVGYITYLLAKSCKLVPVMFLHISIFRRRYPFYKYAVVALVTAGVAVFSLHLPNAKNKSSRSSKSLDGNVVWGATLLLINLLFDGLTNSTQDYINATFKPYTGSQMMCANNLISTSLTTTYLLVAPHIFATPLGHFLNMPKSAGNELAAALSFISRHPTVGYDILAFAAFGAFGQCFIFFTLAKFSSLLLVTITVTRKMISMLVSVVWYGHRLVFWQWVGVALVFGGVGAEAAVGRWEKAKKEKEKKKE